MATITAVTGAAGTWDASTTSTWIGGVAPTQTDDVVIPLATTSITIGVGAVCRSVDFNTFTGTITQGSTGTLTIGDSAGSVPASNIAIRLPSGATYAPNSASTITFISTSSTQQTVSISSSYTCGNITFNSSSNGNYAIIANLTINAASNMTLTKGTLHVDGASDNSGLTHSWGRCVPNGALVRALNLGTAIISLTGADSGSSVWESGGTTNLTFTSGTSEVKFTGVSPTLNTNTLTFYKVTSQVSGTMNLGNFTCNTLTITGAANNASVASFTAGVTVTSSLVIAGDSGASNRILITSSVLGTARTLTSASNTISYADFRDITGAGAGSWNLSAITGNSGDCGGNTSITFTTPATQTATGTPAVTTNWSALTWSGRVPLPQDNATINVDLTTGGGVGINMNVPRYGKDIDFSGITAAASSKVNYTGGVNVTSYGSMIMKSGLTPNYSNTSITFEGRGTHTITSNGHNWLSASGSAMIIASVGGTYTLNDAFNVAGNNNALSLNNGTFNSAGFTVTCQRFVCNGTATRVLTMGASSWVVSSGSATTVWNMSTVTGLTINANTSTITLSDTTQANTKTFNSGTSMSFSNITVSGKNYAFQCTTGMTCTGTFALNNLGDTTGVSLQSSRTYTVGGFTSTASSGNVGKLIASTPGTAATLSKSSGIVSIDWCSIKDSAATGGATWYAGANSTNVSGNTGWLFTAATSIKTFLGLAYASTKTVLGLAIASMKTYNGLA